MIFKQHFNKLSCFLVFLFITWIIISSGCARQPSAENKVLHPSPNLPPQLSNETEGGPEISHPGTGEMAQISFFKNRLKENPKDLEALIFLGNSNFDIRRYEKAKELYLEALSIDPKNVFVRTDLATCYRNLGQTDQSIVELQTVLVLVPDHPPALYNLGVILLNDKGDKQGAIRVWQKLLETHPDHELSKGLAEKINQLNSRKDVSPS